jgi:hypothetical protein
MKIKSTLSFPNNLKQQQMPLNTAFLKFESLYYGGVGVGWGRINAMLISSCMTFMGSNF